MTESSWEVLLERRFRLRWRVSCAAELPLSRARFRAVAQMRAISLSVPECVHVCSVYFGVFSVLRCVQCVTSVVWRMLLSRKTNS